MKRLRVVVLVVMLAGVLAWAAAPYARTLAFVVDASGLDFAWRRWLPIHVADVTQQDIVVPTRQGDVAARVYQPRRSASHHTVLVIPGLHSAGVEEPRLDRLSRRLAGEGMTVVSLPLPDLRRFIVTPQSTDVVEDAARWLADQAALTPSGRIVLIGISFGGGLSLVAAGRPSLAGKLDKVVSVGGHGDLPRVLRYYCTGQLPDGTLQPAHDYGTVIFLLHALPHIVPADQVGALDRVIRVFLDASMVDVSDPPRAAALFREAHDLGEGLPEPARSVMADVSRRDSTRLGPRLLALAETVGGNPVVSPERSPATLVPVFLAHGAQDTVIPQTETPSVAAYLDRAPGRQGTKAAWLLTPLVSHADTTGNVGLGDAWALIRFWNRVLR
jgi:dienelactone hydrolase